MYKSDTVVWQKQTFFVLGALLREKKLRMSIPYLLIYKVSSNFGRESAHIAANEVFKKTFCTQGVFSTKNLSINGKEKI